MTPAPGFFLHHGNDLPGLARALGERLAGGHKSDWLQPDTVLIPQPSMRRWLQNSLAGQFGIAANLDFRLSGQLLDTVLHAWLPAHDPGRFLNFERTQWRVFALLLDDALMASPAFAPVKRFLDASDRQRRAWQLAGEVAQAFEKYQAWRREWLLSWHQTADINDWQSILWHLASQGRTFRAQAVDAYLKHLDSAEGLRPAGLPAHLFVFACQDLSPDVLHILQSFGRWIPVEFFLHNPCQAYWGDIGQRRSVTEIMATDFDNPLLDQWGLAGRDFIASLLSDQSAEWLGEAEHYRRPGQGGNSSLLQLLQQDILDREAPQANRMSREALLADDSVQVHCCAGALREVQMLRNQLLALIRKNPGLQWRDIAVMAPDLDRFAPFFAAVFGHSDAQYPALPFALSESAGTDGSGLRELFFRLLALPQSRFTGNDGMDLLAQPLMAKSLGLAPEDLERLFVWLQKAGVRWGLDAGHRQEIDGVPQFNFTWRFALDRLLYGYASSDALIGDTAPVPMPHGKDQALLDTLFAFTDRIESLRGQLSQAHEAGAWREIIEGMLAWLIDDRMPDGADRDFFEDLKRLLAGLPELADNAGLTQPFGVEVIAAWLAEALAPRLGQAWLSGRITICKMVPMRLIPFKVICVLGLDENAFPRQEPVAAINRLAGKATTARLGDRNTRNDDRFLMLQLLSSCKAHWLLSYSGLNPADGSESPPAIVVQQLLQTAAGYGPGDADTAKALIIRHPIHAFEIPADPRIAVLHGSTAKATRDSTDTPLFADIAGVRGNAVPAAPLDIALPEFIAFWKKPMESLARQHGIRLQLHDSVLEESEPFGKASGLDRYHLVEIMAREWFIAPDGDPDVLLRRLQAEGALAPGRLGRNRLLGLFAEIRPALQALAGEAMAPVRFELEYRHNTARIHGSLVQVHKSGIMTLALHRSEMTPKLRVAAGLQALLAKAGNLDIAIGVRTADRFHDVSLSYSPEQARKHLDTLLEFYHEGHTRILCFDPDASFAWYRARIKNPEADVGEWIEQQLAQDDPRSGNHEPALIDVLTEGRGFLRAVALREPEAFRQLSDSVCAILSGDAS